MNLKRVLLRLFLLGCLLCLLTAGLIYGVYQYVNWIGAKKWSELVAELKARNEPTSWIEVVPPRIPAANNFCAIPLFSCLFNYSQPTGSPDPIYADPLMVEKIMATKVNDSAPEDYPLHGSRSTNALTDLKLWQGYYLKSKDFPKPPLSPRASAATSVIAALDRFRDELDQLTEASRRPDARFSVHYAEEPKFSISFQHYGVSLGLSNVLRLRALAYLHSGQPMKAWSDLRVLLKLHQACEKEPPLMSHLIGTYIIANMLDPLWEGLAMNSWSDNELNEISDSLGKLDYPNEYRRCMQAETMFYAVPLLDYLEVRRGAGLSNLAENDSFLSMRLFFRMIPKGCYDLAKVATIRLLYDQMLPIIDEKTRRYSFAAAKRLEREQKSIVFYSPKNQMAKIFAPLSQSTAKQMVEIQADIDMARIACALEIFHRKTGYYPDGLERLPQPLPHDLITGNPYFYAPTPNGRYKLWTVGWDKVNDSGKVTFRIGNKNLTDRNHGDWVWEYPDKMPVP